jgi:hypothetical protein
MFFLQSIIIDQMNCFLDNVKKKIKNGNNVKPFITWQGFFNRIFSSLDMLSVKMQRLTAGKTRGFDT